MTEPLDPKHFEALLAAYGARVELWPEGEREAALALLATSAPARSLSEREAALDRLFSESAPSQATPALLRRLNELPIRHPRAERPRRFGATVATVLAWSAALALGVLWGAESEIPATPVAETPRLPAEERTDTADIESDELFELALGSLGDIGSEP
jgi:hypothetical protein